MHSDGARKCMQTYAYLVRKSPDRLVGYHGDKPDFLPNLPICHHVVCENPTFIVICKSLWRGDWIIWLGLFFSRITVSSVSTRNKLCLRECDHFIHGKRGAIALWAASKLCAASIISRAYVQQGRHSATHAGGIIINSGAWLDVLT